MILVDTSIWIDHLHHADFGLTTKLEAGEVGVHPLVIQELALGSIRDRAEVLELLGALHQFPWLDHHEVLELVNRRSLWGRGLSAVDTHLLGAAAITPGSTLWTRDKRLRAAAEELGLAHRS